MNHRQSAIAIAITASLLGAVGAQAALISEWDFRTDGGFIGGGATCEFDDGSTSTNEVICGIVYRDSATPSTLDDTFSRVAWGDPVGTGEKSALEILHGDSTSTSREFNDKLVVNSGNFTTVSSISHENMQIWADGGWLNAGKIDTTFALGVSGGFIPDLQFTSRFDFTLLETVNEADVSNCASPNPYSSRCDDVFTLLDTPFAPISFVFQGFEYFVEFQRVAALNTVSGAVNPQDDGSEIIYTGEGAITTVLNQVRMTAKAVPAPGAFPLLAIGLALLGWRRCTRRAA